jgi:hypothetical protein
MPHSATISNRNPLVLSKKPIETERHSELLRGFTPGIAAQRTDAGWSMRLDHATTRLIAEGQRLFQSH